MDISETITLGVESLVVVQQGVYDLTREAMAYRSQRPLYIGDDYTLEFILTDSAGVAVDITGATIKFTARSKFQDVTPIVQKTATVTDPTAGKFTIAIVKTDVTGTDLLRGYYDIEMTLAGSVTTILSGVVEFNQAAT